MPEGRLKLIVHDNGKGLPENFDLEEHTSYGLKLVNIFVRQLNATLLYENKKWLAFYNNSF